MRALYHFPLSPASRIVRLSLSEKAAACELRIERPWERRPDYLAISPTGDVPALLEPDGAAIIDAPAICEYLEEVAPERPLIGGDPYQRAEVRRLVGWFAGRFDRDVTRNLYHEKIERRLARDGQPSSQAIRAGYANLHAHLDYIGYLTFQRNYLAGDLFGLADIAAAAHLSVLDYFGEVSWADHEPAKQWYARVKSRPSFRPLLADQLPGFAPPAHYADLDF